MATGDIEGIRQLVGRDEADAAATLEEAEDPVVEPRDLWAELEEVALSPSRLPLKVQAADTPVTAGLRSLCRALVDPRPRPTMAPWLMMKGEGKAKVANFSEGKLGKGKAVVHSSKGRKGQAKGVANISEVKKGKGKAAVHFSKDKKGRGKGEAAEIAKSKGKGLAKGKGVWKGPIRPAVALPAQPGMHQGKGKGLAMGGPMSKREFRLFWGMRVRGR